MMAMFYSFFGIKMVLHQFLHQVEENIDIQIGTILVSIKCVEVFEDPSIVISNHLLNFFKMQKYELFSMWQNVFLFYSVDGVERVGILAGILDQDAVAVECVDAHLSGGVYDAAVAEVDAYMYYAAVGIAEEG